MISYKQIHSGYVRNAEVVNELTNVRKSDFEITDNSFSVIKYNRVSKIKISVDRLNLSHYFTFPQRNYITIVAHFLLNHLVSKVFTDCLKEISETNKKLCY